MENQKDHIKPAKIAVLGNSGAGKTSLIAIFLKIMKTSQKTNDEILQGTFSTIGTDFTSLEVMVEENRSIKLNIWDTAGQEKYRALSRTVFEGTEGVLLCASLIETVSSQHLEGWDTWIQESSRTNCKILLIGTKSDGKVLPESRKVLEEFAKQKNLKYIETSALTAENVKKAFVELACEISNQNNTRSTAENGRLRIASTAYKVRPPNDRSGCCN